MNAPTLLEHTDTYLASQWHDVPLAPVAPRPPLPFVTISRQAGSGGARLARLLARRLNAAAPRDVVWRVFEGNLTTKMLQANHLDPKVARYLPEDHVPELTASIGELVGLHPNLWDLVQKMNATMRGLAAGGHVILVGRGAAFATAGLPGGVHVRVVAPEAHRAQYLAGLYNIPLRDAARQNARCDAARRRYVKDTFDADVGDPASYTLCLNTAQLPLADAADVIAARVSSLAVDPSHRM